MYILWQKARELPIFVDLLDVDFFLPVGCRLIDQIVFDTQLLFV